MTAAEDAADRAARRLAADHATGPQRSRQTPLLDNLAAQSEFLRQAHATFTRQAQEETILSSNAAEWVLDNFYIVQQALKLIETDMPPSYYRELPKLSAGTWAGYPRVYAVARAIIAQQSARITRAPLEMFVHSYQDIQPLRTGEIWALPVMLRIGIIETLTHAVADVLTVAPPDPIDPPTADLTADTLAGNCILSLRMLAAEDWKAFFEHVSLVEQTLTDDPIGVYPRMEFETRDHYRKEVEALARAGDLSEVDVARQAIHLARQDVDAPPTEQDRRRHVGYYLVDEGRTRLEDELHHVPAPGIRLRRFFYRAHPALTYVGGIGLVTLLLLALLLGYAILAGAGPLLVVLVAAVTVIPAVTFATGLVNWLITSTTAPRLLPKLNFEEGVPADARSMVVVPTLLAGVDDVDPLLTQLEQHYLRNADDNIYFGLLTDFTDAPAEDQPKDAEIVRAAADGIRALNRRYPGDPFYLFHRKRLWNEQEGVWMGWERKRGKLEEFNRLLLNHDETTYAVQVGDLARLPSIRFVITLDEDTVLPRDAARRLIGALAHPLNCARFAEDNGEVTAGYTLLQPRTEIKPVSATRSRFSRIFSGVSGLDLYSHAVSDIYQDLFGEGIYVGKGIYDVHALARSLEGRIPENALLSHDLFEGILGRAALVTDVVLYEEYPADYLTYAHRRHRWIRGDWQLLPWLRRRVPQRTPEPVANPLSFIDRWKVLDNLRRSLDAPATLLWLLGAWLWLPGSPFVWTFLTLLFSAGTLVSSLFGAVLRGVGDGFLRGLRRQFQRWLIMLIFLPYEAIIALHAITIVIRRLFFTHRHLLEWTTAASTASIFGSSNRTFLAWHHMIGAPIIALAAGAAILWMRPGAFLVALPFLSAWLISPQLAVWLSRGGERPAAPLRPADVQELRNVARSTWLYFEQFMGPVDHWLPPDHYQEDPRGLVAHRTSPTNIGLGLLSTLAAYDLGYVGLWELTLRLENSLQALDELEQYRGHLLNWYDTRTQKPLPPRYVSSVDSGNLAACLIALRQGVLDLPNVALPRWERWQGFVDTLAMLETAMDDLSEAAPDPIGEIVASVKEQIFHMRTQTLDRRDHPEQWTPLLASLTRDAWPRLEADLVGLLEQYNPSPAVLQRIRIWTERVRHDLFDMQRRIGALVPWLTVLEEAPSVIHSVTQAGKDEALAQAWAELVTLLPQRVRVADILDLCGRARRPLADLRHAAMHATLSPEEIAAVHDWCDLLSTRLDESCAAVTRLLDSIQNIADRCQTWVDGMNFTFLYDKQRRVFRIGYNVDAEIPDPNYYDLLASESRSTSLIAIAKGDVPQSHWLHLGRPVTNVNGRMALMSWSGTMFEYLMPILWTRQYPNTLLYQSARTAVHAHRAFARQKKVPWGISESGYYRFDAAMNYQYRAFGAPQLGFKRGLEEDTVIAPYASLLALPLYPNAVMDNLKRLRDLGMWGDYGFYEAIDFTSSRLALGQESARVRSFMVHHQGMVLLSVLNTLNDDLMVRRFHADPHIQSVELLLQERVPAGETLQEERAPEEDGLRPVERLITAQPWSVPVDTPAPQAHFLSNGRYGVLLTNAGGGFSRWQETDLTRWRADTTCDDWGTWIYVQEMQSGDLWSAAVQPVIDGHTCDVTFAPHKVDFQCERQRIATHTEVTVPPGDDLEIRRVRVTNQSDEPRRLRLVSYAEIVLGQQDTDRRHPAFNKMFIQGDYAADKRTLIFTRRPRSRHETPPFFGHAVVVEAGRDAVVHYETDRERFLGRNGRMDAPAALTDGGGLTDNAGPVLDPIASFAVEIELEPHTTATLAFLSAAGVNHADVMTSIEKYRDWARLDRSFRLAEAQSELEMRQLEVDGDTLRRFQQLLSLLLYPSAALRADVAQITANTLGQSGLWPYAISGDYPILLARIHGEEHLALARELLQAHTYWRNRGLMIDLVLVNEEAVGYNQELQGQLRRLLDRMNSDHWVNRRGGIFLLQRGVMSAAEQNLLAAAARVVLDGDRGDLDAHLRNVLQQPARLPAFVPARDDYDRPVLAPPERPADLQFDNGWGGFTDQGCEYVIYRRPGDPTPAPWSNVIANPEFGFLVSETGGGYTWAANSGENRLTPWSNDPVLDRPGEALYLRDEETAAIWSPTPNPAGAETPHLIRHGAGYSVFESHSHGLDQQVRLYAVPDAALKVIHLRLHNRWEHTRRVTATYYAEWVLGVNRDQMQQYIVPEYAAEHNALLARNPYNAEFGGRVAFLAACDEPHGLSTDRTEFLGRLGDMRRPVGLTRVGLTNTVQSTTDPCAAIQLHIDLQPGEVREIYFVLGQGEDRDDALRLIEQFRGDGASPSGKGTADFTASAQAVVPFPEGSPQWHAARDFWDDFLDAVHVETPDAAMNVLLNRWLPYQNASCRVWGRSAFYQSSGAYGFRDQLQDVGALLHHAPHEARRHILRAARHQFDAGDVLHWWHPPAGRGVRTRISDDLLWLPYITAHYVHTTGDASILDEEIPFRLGEPLQPEEEERYSLYELSETTVSLYEHCCRALNRGSTAGRHGLPLMGAGDWNDGMNRVGIEGEGESVWLGWFLYATLDAFLPLAEGKDDAIRAAVFRQKMTDLRAALHNHAWDGEWYLRAFYDDGSPLGSAGNRECRIDAIAQSWSVLSGAGDPERSRQALSAMDKMLVSEDEQLIRLFTPAFDKTPRDPGYIKGYPPGIRENGGQYTHAAIWAVWSYAAVGDGDRAGELFRLLNPVLHSDTRAKAAHYRVEPYVIAADVYGVDPFTGRGGWTWYTGSGGWYYRLGTEAILGLRREGAVLRLDPCIPRDWDGYRITYRFGGATYVIDVENPEHVNKGVVEVVVDGKVNADGEIPLVDDGVMHRVVVRMGNP